MSVIDLLPKTCNELLRGVSYLYSYASGDTMKDTPPYFLICSYNVKSQAVSLSEIRNLHQAYVSQSRSNFIRCSFHLNYFRL